MLVWLTLITAILILQDQLVANTNSAQKDLEKNIELNINIAQARARFEELGKALKVNDAHCKKFFVLDRLQRLHSVNGPFVLVAQSVLMHKK